MQSNVKNEYMGNEYGNVNVRNVSKLMLGMLRSFDGCNVRSECGNVSSECGNVRSECFDRCKYMNEC